jgi:hypothetical protein
VGNEKFRVICRSSQNPKSGAFKVRIGDFADAVAVAVLARSDEKQSKEIATELKAVLSATKRSYDVEIIEREWEVYRQTHPAVPETKGKGGRRPKEGWRDLCVIIGAYLMKHVETTREPLKAEYASEVIFSIGKTDNIPGLPAAGTIKDVLSAIKAKSPTISID